MATTFLSGACSAAAIAYERLKRAISGLPVTLNLINASLPDNLEEWGLADVIIIGKRKVNIGPPPSESKLSRIVRKELKKLRTSRFYCC